MTATKRNVKEYGATNIFLHCACGGTWPTDIVRDLALDDIPVCPECFTDVQIAEALTVLD